MKKLWYKLKRLFCFSEQQESYLDIRLFRDYQNRWRWRIIAGNGEILATSEAYSSKQNAENSSKLIQKSKFIIYKPK